MDRIKERRALQQIVGPKASSGESEEQKVKMGMINYFTLWAQSVHSLPHYLTIALFLQSGYSPKTIFLGIMLGAVLASSVLALNGCAGSKYKLSFSRLVKISYGKEGGKGPGILRGLIIAMLWYGLQIYLGGQILMALLGKLFPAFLSLECPLLFGQGQLPMVLSYGLFWLLNVAFGIGGGKALNKVIGFITPIVYLGFGLLALGVLQTIGGIGEIFAFHEEVTPFGLVLSVMIVANTILGIWAAPMVSVADFTQKATSTAAQVKGQVSGLLFSYLFFAFTSLILLRGGAFAYGVKSYNFLEIIQRLQMGPGSIAFLLLFLLTTLVTNVTGNMVPAAYQLMALFPKRLSYSKSVVGVAILSFLSMSWRWGDQLTIFLNGIGSLLGPITGVMLAHFYWVKHQHLSEKDLVLEKISPFHKEAYVATLIGTLGVYVLKVLSAFSALTQMSWLVGFGLSFLSEGLLSRRNNGKKEF
ncbi:allantoin permease [Aerococcus christensenii]|uniref:Allantoin permease n=1 Tax=Aerococcus christensenii TaxID=87541 RepID=A0A2I1K571_9LACT|nr:cytosine permease [Aerococcus christensenii]PKY90791.1 allantoin permease [Aerococcus christensenii]